MSRRFLDGEVADAERALASAKEAAERLPWGLAAGVAGGCAVFGYGLGGLAGVVVGPLVGFFLGHGTIDRARSGGRHRIATAEDQLASIREIRRVATALPEIFSLTEELSGVPDDKPAAYRAT
ncbi:hypothetical protein [Arenibaculum pallidiluteum]|uniref:hypothetical protein n=1 Tax=Arenibaculum pallidiluteum TaxID=2812559 RepID=UPI001A97009D|nr:hypothetical protein [Arenibaculum pallidiluteum]